MLGERPTGGGSSRGSFPWRWAGLLLNFVSRGISIRCSRTRGHFVHGPGLASGLDCSQSSFPRLAHTRTVEMSIPNWLAIAPAVR